MVISADTSFLFSLYGNDVNTSRALAWLRHRRSPLVLSVLAEFELANALRFAEFRKAIAVGDAARFWSQFETDRQSGRIAISPCNLADVVAGANKLSSGHTLSGGHRGFDILHVSAALLLESKVFLTFDSNQKKLAKSQGLQTPL